MPTIQANGVTLHYLQAGKGPDLIMLHGLSGNLATWHHRIVPLLQSSFRITTYDLRGHGRSSMPLSGYTTRDMAADLVALMDGLGIASADLAGHSFGADIALHFALLYPTRAGRLTLIEPGIAALVHGRSHGEWGGWRQWARDLERLTGQPVPREHRTDLGYMLRRSIEGQIVSGPLKGLPQRTDRIFRLFDTTTIIADHTVVGDLTLDNLAAIPQQKLLVCDGESASISSFTVLRNLLTNCTALVVPGTQMPHFAPLEAPASLIEHVTRFLGTHSHPDAVSPAPVGLPFTLNRHDAETSHDHP
jgi:pimeloyl-ACP methyl ester carboxylesterase